MTQFIKQGNIYTVSKQQAVESYDKLPLGTYTIKFNPEIGLYLEKIDDYQLPQKIYGETNGRAERILNTFYSRPNATGVMLAGQAGSGKTLLAKRISILAREQDAVSTIVVNSPLSGETFNTFIQAIEEPIVMIFDEFEKVYREEEGAQEQLLTLFDGAYPSKKMFIITTNESGRVNTYLHNRPGRMFYSFNYSGITDAFIQEYCEDNLNDIKKLDGIFYVASVVRVFTFDMLKAIVEEMNRYDEDAKQVLDVLNININSNRIKYDILVKENGKEIDSFEKQIMLEPIVSSFSIDVRDDSQPGVEEDFYIVLKPEHLVKFDAKTGKHYYKTVDEDNGFTYEVYLTKTYTKEVDYWSAF